MIVIMIFEPNIINDLLLLLSAQNNLDTERQEANNRAVSREHLLCLQLNYGLPSETLFSHI